MIIIIIIIISVIFVIIIQFTFTCQAVVFWCAINLMQENMR